MLGMRIHIYVPLYSVSAYQVSLIMLQSAQPPEGQSHSFCGLNAWVRLTLMPAVTFTFTLITHARCDHCRSYINVDKQQHTNPC